MFFVYRNGVRSIDKDKLNKYDKKGITVLDYNDINLGTYAGILAVVNEIYHRLTVAGKNKETLAVMHTLVESMNNLNHFHVSIQHSDPANNTIETIMECFETFKYKPMVEPQAENGISIYKTKLLPYNDFEKLMDVAGIGKLILDENTPREYYLRDDEFLDPTLDKDMYPDEFSLLSNDPTTRVLSVTNDDGAGGIITELRAVFQEVKNLEKSTLSLKGQPYFRINKKGFHEEIVVAISTYFDAFLYLMNSYSMTNKEFFEFDRFEIERRTYGGLELFIKRAEQVARHQIL